MITHSWLGALLIDSSCSGRSVHLPTSPAQEPRKAPAVWLPSLTHEALCHRWVSPTTKQAQG